MGFGENVFAINITNFHLFKVKQYIDIIFDRIEADYKF